MNTPQPDVLIIGAGIIGLTLAYELSLRGTRVTVIDQFDPGEGCSYGNAGWITPCFAQPLPMPGLMLQSFKWLLNPLSPLYIKLEASWFFIKWLTRFLRSMNHATADRSVAALVEMSGASLETYLKWAEVFPVSFSLAKKGLLMVAQSEAACHSAMDQMAVMAKHGVMGNDLNAAQVRQLEPAVTGDIKGGVYFPHQAHAEPFEVVNAVAAVAIQQGVNIISGTEVFDFLIAGQSIQGVRTTRGDFFAKQIVLATGAWSYSLGKKLKLSIPVMGGKGYATTFRSLKPVLDIPTLIVDKKIAVTPRKNGVRVAGTLELVNQDFSINSDRLQAVLNGAKDCIHFPEGLDVIEMWRGLRPCTPDGVPIIGFSDQYQNLFVTTGHQMLGLQTAPASARLAADLLTGVTPCFDCHPFKMSRF